MKPETPFAAHADDAVVGFSYENVSGNGATYTATYTGAMKHKCIAISQLANQWAN